MIHEMVQREEINKTTESTEKCCSENTFCDSYESSSCPFDLITGLIAGSKKVVNECRLIVVVQNSI